MRFFLPIMTAILILLLSFAIAPSEARAKPQALSPALELELRPAIRARALEMAIVFPVSSTRPYVHLSPAEADYLNRLRLELVKHVEGLPADANLLYWAESMAVVHIERLALKQPDSPSATTLFEWCISYLARHASGVEMAYGLTGVLGSLRTQKRFRELTPRYEPLLENLIDSVAHNPAPAFPRKNRNLPQLPESVRDLVQERATALASRLLEEAHAKVQAADCAVGLRAANDNRKSL